jgi:hypothetical protein
VARVMPVLNGRRPSRNAPWSVSGALLLMLVIAGLLLMHGVQSSAGPTDIRGVPLVSSSQMHQPATGEGRSGGHSCDCNDHQHPGGQMCLALLVLGALFLLATLLIRCRRERTTTRRPAGRGHAHPGRPPPAPSIFQLSVLRR